MLKETGKDRAQLDASLKGEKKESSALKGRRGFVERDGL